MPPPTCDKNKAKKCFFGHTVFDPTMTRVTTLIGHVTIRLVVGHFLSWTDACTHARTDVRQVILYSVQCCTLHCTDN